MNKHDDKKQLRRHKKKVKQLGNQTARSRTKKLLREDPTSDELQEPTNYGKLTSTGLNGLDIDKTRKTEYHQQHQQKPQDAPQALETLEVAAVGVEALALVLDLVAAAGEATA